MVHERSGEAKRSTFTWVALLSALVVVLMAAGVARLSLYRPINADEAYNLQIAKSIATNFCYCTRYRPERIFPAEESTNGVAQYVAAAFFAGTNNPDVAKAGAAAVAVLVLGVALFALDSWLVFLTAVLFILWYVFVYVSINFVGEPWAAAFALLGVAALRRCDFSTSLRVTLMRAPFILAMLCFGVASESKLVAALAVVPIAFGIAYQKYRALDEWMRIARAGLATVAVAAGTAFVLFLLVAFSVIHSMRAIDPIAIWRTFFGFLANMVSQGQGQAQPFDVSHILAIVTQMDSGLVLALYLISAAFLVFANRGYVLFVAATLLGWLHYGGNERHVFISFFLTIVLAGLEARTFAGALRGGRVRHRRMAFVAGMGLAILLVTVAIVSRSTLYAPGLVKRFAHRTHMIQTAEGRYHYSRKLVDVLRRQRYVLTSGWWQFPDLTLRENLEFYDRMSPANAGLPRAGSVLFFDKGNPDWPRTSVAANCGPVVYTEGPVVVCKPKLGVPLSFQPVN